MSPGAGCRDAAQPRAIERTSTAVVTLPPSPPRASLIIRTTAVGTSKATAHSGLPRHAPAITPFQDPIPTRRSGHSPQGRLPFMTISQGPVAVVEAHGQPFRNPDFKEPVMASNARALEIGQMPDRGRYLVVSPYHGQDHLLDIESLDLANQLLALSLTKLKCFREDYATAPYIETFNWNAVFGSLQTLAQEMDHRWKDTSFFVVAFRSRIPPTTVYAELGTLDQAAHAEATASGGFLQYWFGTPDGEGRDLATCIWRSEEDAKKWGVGPAHRKAAAVARSLYSLWKIDRLKLTIEDDLKGWAITRWDERRK